MKVLISPSFLYFGTTNFFPKKLPHVVLVGRNNLCTSFTPKKQYFKSFHIRDIIFIYYFRDFIFQKTKYEKLQNYIYIIINIYKKNTYNKIIYIINIIYILVQKPVKITGSNIVEFCMLNTTPFTSLFF